LAKGLQDRLRERGVKVELLDGDEIRQVISRELGFSKEDRNTQVRRIGYIAQLLTRNGVVAIVAAISPYREMRNLNRRNIRNFIEVYCRCPVEVAEKRDNRGLYRKARAGEIKSFTGIDDPYEVPLKAEVIVDTDRETVEESLQKIWCVLQTLGY
jgi:adenylyl-sulfate kinase